MNFKVHHNRANWRGPVFYRENTARLKKLIPKRQKECEAPDTLPTSDVRRSIRLRTRGTVTQHQFVR